MARDCGARSVDAFLVLNEEKRERAREGLGRYCRQGRPRYTPLEGENEERRERGVENRPTHRRDHSRPRPILRAQAVRNRHRYDLEDEAYRYNADVGPRQRHDGHGRPKNPEDGINKYPTKGHDRYRGYDGGKEGLSEDGKCFISLSCAHGYRYERSRSNAEGSPNALRHEHHRETGDHRSEGVCAHALAYKDPVDEIAEAVHEHDRNGGERELQGSAFVSFLARATPLPWISQRLFSPLAVDAARCTRCGLCEKGCPVSNIVMEESPIHGAAANSACGARRIVPCMPYRFEGGHRS